MYLVVDSTTFINFFLNASDQFTDGLTASFELYCKQDYK